jgi:negative regulator of flagellin synthesis FlgM
MATVVSAGSEAPVDQDRVAEIREAIEHGRYPVIPTKIADAMIAAGFLLRND